MRMRSVGAKDLVTRLHDPCEGDRWRFLTNYQMTRTLDNARLYALADSFLGAPDQNHRTDLRGQLDHVGVPEVNRGPILIRRRQSAQRAA
jgi:hypothetical protein